LLLLLVMGDLVRQFRLCGLGLAISQFGGAAKIPEAFLQPVHLAQNLAAHRQGRNMIRLNLQRAIQALQCLVEPAQFAQGEAAIAQGRR